METISISEAKSRFSEFVSRASGGERFVLQRRQRDAAALIGIAELKRLERSSLAAHRLAIALGQRAEILGEIEGGEAHPAMAAFGLWRDKDALLDELGSRIYEERIAQPSRPQVEL